MKNLIKAHLFYALVLASLWASTHAYGDEDKAIVSRGEDKLAKVFVNVGGTVTETASFGDPANCATSGATQCSGVYTPTINTIEGMAADTDNDGGQKVSFPARFIRSGNEVSVCGLVRVDLTSAIDSQVDITLPIARSTPSVAGDIRGTGTAFALSSAAIGLGGTVLPGNPPSSATEVRLSFDPDGGLNDVHISFCFIYELD